MTTALTSVSAPQVSPLAGDPIAAADARRLATVLKALADPARLRLLMNRADMAMYPPVPSSS